ncbi:MAG: hypothetical protein LLG08_00565 [Actinomycetia bacterium]|nr:hypothetical protein [Actinomycetes bacterium]
MTSEEWADWLDATTADRYRYSGDMFRGLVANLAAAEKRAEKWETAASGYIISNNVLAAQLAECKRLSRERDTMLDEAGNKILALKAELADYRAYYEWSVSPQKNGDIPEVITGEVRAVIDRIEARRAKEAQNDGR